MHGVRVAFMAIAGASALVTAAPASAAETPKYGGELTYVVPASHPPSFDAHRETTYAVIHPLRPFYSTLIRVNPANPGDPSDFVCDLCVGAIPTPTDDGKTYVFKLHKGVVFHDGEPLTSGDVKASFERIIFPPKGVTSVRKSFYRMVEAVEAPNPMTVVFRLKHASSALIPALAAPFNFIYSKRILNKDQHWYETNVLGSGPFIFKAYEPGRYMTGERNPRYYLPGLPYLDRITAMFESDEAAQIEDLLEDRVAAQFRGVPPKARDQLVAALGDQITVQEADWNCVLLATPNHARKPFDDVRVRRALTLAIDRWGGSEYLSERALVKTVGGIVFPSHALAASVDELKQLDGYGTDMEANRARARDFLAAAGVDLTQTYVFNNRRVDQPYKAVGVWLIDQWRQIGLNFEQKILPTTEFYATMRTDGDFDVTMDFNCQSVVNPPIDTAKYLSSDNNPQNYSRVIDPKIDALYDAMLLESDPVRQREQMRVYEKYILHDQVTQMITLWWRRITVHRSYVKGWKISPSHYLGQALDTVWIDRDADAAPEEDTGAAAQPDPAQPEQAKPGPGK